MLTIFVDVALRGIWGSCRMLTTGSSAEDYLRSTFGQQKRQNITMKKYDARGSFCGTCSPSQRHSRTTFACTSTSSFDNSSVRSKDSSLFGKLIMSITYGIDVRTVHDPYIVIAQKALNAVNMTGNIGTYLVDSIPLRNSNPQAGGAWIFICLYSEVLAGVVPRRNVPERGSRMEG